MANSSNQGPAPNSDDLERLAGGIKPSWELDDAPFSMGNRALTAAEWAALHGKSGPNADLQDALIEDSHGIVPSDLVSEPIGFGTQSGIGAGIAPYVAAVPAPAAGPPAALFPPPAVAPPPQAVAAPAPASVQPAHGAPAYVAPAPRAMVAPAVAQPRPVAPPAYSSSSLSDEYPVQKSRKGIWIGLGGLVVVAAAAFGIRAATSGPESAPATQPTSNTTTTTTTATTPTSTAAATAKTPERDIPPPPAATEVTPPVETAKAAPVATTPPAPTAKLAPPPVVHPPPTTKATAKQTPRTPPPSAPSKPPAKPGGGGIVRDVPF